MAKKYLLGVSALVLSTLLVLPSCSSDSAAEVSATSGSLLSEKVRLANENADSNEIFINAEDLSEEARAELALATAAALGFNF